MRRFLVVVPILVLAGVLAGCSSAVHEEIAAKADSTAEVVKGAKEVISSELAKGIATGIAAIPVPAAQAVPVARAKVEGIMEAIIAALALLAADQRRRAMNERTKKKAYKATCSPEGLTTANKLIYGDNFDPKLSK